MKNLKAINDRMKRVSAKSGNLRNVKIILKMMIEELEELHEKYDLLGYVHSDSIPMTNFSPIPETNGTPLTDIIANMETEEGTTDEGAEDPEPTEDISRLVRDVAEVDDSKEEKAEGPTLEEEEKALKKALDAMTADVVPEDEISEDVLFDILDKTREDLEEDTPNDTEDTTQGSN